MIGSNHGRFPRHGGKKRLFLLHNGFLRFLFRSKFQFVSSSSAMFQTPRGSNHGRFPRHGGKKRLFLLHNGFLRFLFRSKFKFVPSSSGMKLGYTDHNNTVDKSKSKKMNDDFTIENRPHPFRLPQKIAKKLYPHQIKGLKWLMSLYRKGQGGILADDMGLGKTVQICCFIAGLFYSNLATDVLIVCPLTILNQWKDELSYVGLKSQKKNAFIFGAEDLNKELPRGKVVYLETYEAMAIYTPKDVGKYEASLDYMFLDEGHRVKNPATKTAKSLSHLHCRYRIIITATPLQNNILELWALFQFCVPGLLGDKNEFLNKYGCICRLIEKNTSINEKNLGYSAVQTLRKSIRPYFLRRTKSNVGIALPKKNDMVIWLKLTSIQVPIYFVFSFLFLFLTRNFRLLKLTSIQICDHPVLLKGKLAEDVLKGMDSFVDEESHLVAREPLANIEGGGEIDFEAMRYVSCKISFISSLLNNLLPKGHFILIFSQTVRMLDQIQHFLSKHVIAFSRLDGSTKPPQRKKFVEDFQEGKGPQVLLLSSRVGAFGLTLTKADRVILVNPSWNPCIDNQCIDRAYRIGQTKDVIMYRLITCGTIEEKTYVKQVLKECLFRIITENKEQPCYFSRQDSEDMYSLPMEEAFDSSQAQLQLPEQRDHLHMMEESFQQHTKFLHTLDIAGVTHHNLLFSNTVLVQGVVEMEVGR